MASLDATVTVEVLNAHQIESLAAALEDAQAEITRLSISPPPDGTVLVLRCCDKDGRSHGGFQWPESGPVECADWSALAVCGQGLHGWLWGEGDVSCSSIHGDPESRWYVVEVSAADVVDLGGKVKFPRGVVAFSGARVEAVAYLAARSPAGNRTIYGTATAGDAGTIAIRYYDPKRDKYRVAIAEVGENGIEPNTAYVLDADHRFVKKTDAHRDSLQVKASLQDLGGEG